MDENKIIIINLSKGRVGEANANLLGSMLITKIYLAAMSRADVQEKELQKLPNFYLYVDEFQSFANESFADILSEARKYKLNLTIAHQYIEQMSEEVRAAVFGNVGTMITFRVGAFDAEVLEKEFAPQFTAEDLVNLGFAQIYLKLMIDGVSSMPFSATTMPPIKEPEVSFRQQVIDMSRKQFAVNRNKVEQDVIDWHKEGGKVENKTEVKKPARTSEEGGEIKKASPEPVKKFTPPVAPAPRPAQTFKTPKYVKREEIKPLPPKLEEISDDDFVPLTELKVKTLPIQNINNNTTSTNNKSEYNQNKKVVNEKSLSELRAVLQKINKPKDQEINKKEVKNKEVPEDKLRQILQVDNNPSKTGK